MEEREKISSFPCPSCGATMHFDPSSCGLKCDYCGALKPISMQVKDTQEGEMDLAPYLESDKSSEKGYGIDTKSLSCDSCGASIDVDPKIKSLNCPFCGSPHVVESKEVIPSLRPHYIAPFAIDSKKSNGIFNDWIGKGWFHPNDLKKMARVTGLTGLYVSFWTFDAVTDSAWTADSGTYYNVPVTVFVNEGGRSVSRVRNERRIKWEPASGNRHDIYDDVLVPASATAQAEIIGKIYPYETKRLAIYDPSFLAGWAALNPTVPLKESAQVAYNLIRMSQEYLCEKDVPGDTCRNLQVNTNISNVKFKPILLPLWIGALRYNGKAYPFLVNGQTGVIYGRKPYSPVKIAFAVCFAILTAVILYFLFK